MVNNFFMSNTFLFFKLSLFENFKNSGFSKNPKISKKEDLFTIFGFSRLALNERTQTERTHENSRLAIDLRLNSAQVFGFSRSAHARTRKTFSPNSQRHLSTTRITKYANKSKIMRISRI